MSMSTKERGILVGLAIVLAAATAFIVIKAKEQRDESDATVPVASGDFDTRRLPDIGTPLREFQTEGGVTVQVIREGRGEPVGKGQAMDVLYTGYSAASGAIFQRGVKENLVLERGGVIAGWIEGLEGIKVREKRRLLIPSALAYGSKGRGNIRPHADLVFDVEWVQLEIEDVKVGDGKEARAGSRVLVHYKGTLENGTVFDSSHLHSPPEPIWLTLKLGKGGVIAGWARGMVGMKVGGRRKLWIPYHLAYQDRGSGKVPPYANLDFDIELLDVE